MLKLSAANGVSIRIGILGSAAQCSRCGLWVTVPEETDEKSPVSNHLLVNDPAHSYNP
jgi:hypothetical protein